MIGLEAEVLEVIQRTHNVKSFRFKMDKVTDFKPGQFLQTTIKIGQKEIRHYLSISNSPTESGYIEFTKKITESEFSQTLDKLKPGDSIKLKYPYGAFTFAGEYKKIAFLSGGIGITPIRSITKYVVDKNLDTDVTLLYGNRTIKDIAFKEDFDMMQKGYPKLRVVHILSQAEAGWSGRTGHINGQVIKEEIPDFIERKFYICGSPAMVEAMNKILQDELALSSENIITENFIGY